MRAIFYATFGLAAFTEVGIETLEARKDLSKGFLLATSIAIDLASRQWHRNNTATALNNS